MFVVVDAALLLFSVLMEDMRDRACPCSCVSLSEFVLLLREVMEDGDEVLECTIVIIERDESTIILTDMNAA